MRVNGICVDGIMKVENARVYGLEESIIASGYPKAVETTNMDECHPVTIFEDEDWMDFQVEESYLKRARYLGRAVPGSGHDCYLKGITVQFDLQLPEYIWRQLDRYHHIDFVSSQSKMHKILELDINDICNKYVSRESINQLNYFIEMYNNYEKYKERGVENIILRDGERIEFTKENIFRMIIANTPCGLMLTARMTTNYLQLKSMILQREGHKMQEWIYLTNWFKSLPLVEDIVLRREAKAKK